MGDKNKPAYLGGFIAFGGADEKKNRPKIGKSPHHANTKSAYLRGFYTVKNN